MSEIKIKDLREWLDEVDKIGELKHVTQEIDPKLEMSAITYLNGLNPDQPTLLFENAKGFDNHAKILFNPLGSSLGRISLALRLKPGRSALEISNHLKNVFNKKIPPITVDSANAPIFENIIEEDKINLLEFPVPTHWPRDGGPYIGTADAIITKDPETGRINLGTYRQQLFGKDLVGYACDYGSDTARDRQKWWDMGKPCPIVCVYGIDPLIFACACSRFDTQESEYDYAGGLNGEAIEVVPGLLTNLPIPAGAEFAIEGYSYPDQTVTEGPFGEYTGYYGRPKEPGNACIRAKKLYHRNQPILTAVLMADLPGSNGMSHFNAILRSSRIWDNLVSGGVPGVKSVWCPPVAAMAFHMTVVSMKQLYPGHAQQIGAFAAQCAAGAVWCKYIVVVDEDIDPTNLEQVVWAITTRCDPVEHIDFLRNTWSSKLDPSLPPEKLPFASKALIFACKEFKRIDDYSKRTGMTEETYEKVSAKWSDLGLGALPEPPFLDDLK